MALGQGGFSSNSSLNFLRICSHFDIRLCQMKDILYYVHVDRLHQKAGVEVDSNHALHQVLAGKFTHSANYFPVMSRNSHIHPSF